MNSEEGVFTLRGVWRGGRPQDPPLALCNVRILNVQTGRVGVMECETSWSLQRVLDSTFPWSVNKETDFVGSVFKGAAYFTLHGEEEPFLLRNEEITLSSLLVGKDVDAPLLLDLREHPELDIVFRVRGSVPVQGRRKGNKDADDGYLFDLKARCSKTSNVWNTFACAMEQAKGFTPTPSEYNVPCGWRRSALAATFESASLGNGSIIGVTRHSSTHLLKRLVSRIPDQVVFIGVEEDGLPTLVPSTQEAWTVERLVALSEEASFGKGNQTVMDPNVRRTLEIHPSPDKCSVVWPGLDAVLSRASKALMQGRRLSGSLYKILVYREGDFFDWHWDAKHSNDHVLTLSVDLGIIGGQDCQGGELIFRSDAEKVRQDNDEHDDNDEDEGTHDAQSSEALNGEEEEKEGALPKIIASWTSSGKGSFACWFASQPHAVTKVTSGFRVVAIYNISLVDSHAAPEPIPSPSYVLQGVSPLFHLIGSDMLQWIISFLDLQSIARLGRTCKALSMSPVAMLLLFLRHRKDSLISETRDRSFHRLGHVLRHQYAFNGGSEVPLGHIRGCDAIVVAAMAQTFGLGSVSTARCFVRYETDHEEGWRVLGTKIFQMQVLRAQLIEEIDENKQGWNQSTYKLPPELIHLLPPGRPNELTDDFRYRLQSTQTEWDNSYDSDWFWPFFHTVWLTTEEELIAKKPSRVLADGSLEYMWGNASTFDMWWYKDTALLVEVCQPVLSDAPLGQDDFDD